MKRVLRRLIPGSADVLFVSTSPIDEIWTRTTALACKAAGLEVEVAVCDGAGAGEPNAFQAYRDAGIRAGAGEFLHCAARVRCRLAVTASSGLDRKIFPTRARYLVHMPHSLASLHMIYPAGAFDGYDVLLAAGSHHETEFKALAAERGLQGRQVFAAGYGKLDVMAREYRERRCGANARPRVLVAPSWGPDNLLDRCGVDLAGAMAAQGMDVVVRPHPLFFLDRAPVLDAIRALAERQPLVRLESPFDGDGAIFEADVLVGDYSGIGFEFAALRRRPVVSVDVGLKVANANWRSLGIEPVEVALRPELGPVVPPEPAAIMAAVRSVLEGRHPFRPEVMSHFLHGEPGGCGARAAELLTRLMKGE